MESQYIQPASEVPRLQLWDLHLALAQLYMAGREWVKVINSALKSLSSLGYVIDGGSLPRKIGTPLVIKQWGFFVDSTMDSWGVLGDAYRLLAPDLVKQASHYAKLSYRISMGEDDTFEETIEQLR